MKKKFWVTIAVVSFMINIIILSTLSYSITLRNLAYGGPGAEQKAVW